MSFTSSFRSVLISSLNSINNINFQTLIKSFLHNNYQNKSLVYIPTAKYIYNNDSTKSKGEQRRKARYEAKQKINLLSNSLSIDSCVLLELDDPKLNPSKLNEIVKNACIIYIEGGNTFYLQKYLIETKFWDIAKPYLFGSSPLEKPQCLYIGASAGAIVLGKSIETAYWKGWDDPNAAGNEYVWTKDKLSGASLIKDTSFFMHYDDSKYHSLVTERKLDLDHNLQLISDNMALIYSSTPIISDYLERIDNIKIDTNEQCELLYSYKYTNNDETNTA